MQRSTCIQLCMCVPGSSYVAVRQYRVTEIYQTQGTTESRVRVLSRDTPDCSTCGSQSGPTALAERYGYSAETHHVRTADGYVLTLARMRGRHGRSVAGAPPVLLWHGMFGSSDVFLLLGPQVGAGFLLADAGYDVWLANSRGNIYSKSHTYLRTNSSAYWDFSWHEIGFYDIPASIDYILGATGHRQLFFVGHSMGTTAFFVMGSLRPDYNAKIRTAYLLAPVVYVSAGQSVNAIERVVNMTNRVLETAYRMKLFEIPGPGFLLRFCPQRRRLCAVIYPLAIGSTYITKESQVAVLGALPAGGSLQQLQHYLDVWSSGVFRPLRRGPRAPASYPLHRVTAPLFFFRGKDDWSFSPKDVRRLKRAIGINPREYVVPLPRFQHNDFIFAPQAGSLVYMQIAQLMGVNVGKK